MTEREKIFLQQLDRERERTMYVRITSLSHNDLPREQIEGRVTGGTINIDGKSAIRRSCNISLIAFEDDQEAIINDIYWCYDNKFKLEIGLQNNIDTFFPDIIWFNMGIYLISTFSKTTNTNSISISIAGKDKMCRLNGEMGGVLPMSNDFGTEEYEEGDSIIINKIPIRTIIEQAVQEYGQELPHNIIINELPNYGYELWEYMGDNAIYFIIREPGVEKVYDENSFLLTDVNGNYLLTKSQKMKGINVEILNITFNIEYLLNSDQLKKFKFYSFNTLDKNYNNNASTIVYNNQLCYIAKVSQGEIAGYHQTPLIYTQDLILKEGEPVTSLIQKLSDSLVNFEFFYDLDGHFVFQKQKTYTQELFSPINGEVVEPIAIATPYEYIFEDNSLFTSISSSPKIGDIKNEFSIWGIREGTTDVSLHARYAIQKKPTSYISPYGPRQEIKNLTYIQFEQGNNSENRYKVLDGVFVKTEEMENVYIIAKQDNKYFENSQLYQSSELNTKFTPFIIYNIDNHYFTKEEDQSYTALKIKNNDKNFYIEEPLPYFTYSTKNYTTEKYDWRELIYQMAIDFYAHHHEDDYRINIEIYNPEFIGGKTKYEQYYSDLQGYWRQLYNPTPTEVEIAKYGEYYTSGPYQYWNQQIHNNPTNLNFWFDFLDTGGEVAKYNVETIGSRPKTINETQIKSIYYKEIPEVLFILQGEQINDEMFENAYAKIQIQKNLEEVFVTSTQGLSAINRANELINQHLGIADSISITSIPIFYLQPNTRVYIDGIGDCVLEKISYNLSYNGTMSLTCNKILQSLG